MKKMPIIFGSDAAGSNLKVDVLNYLKNSRGFSTWDITDVGNDSSPRISERVAQFIIRKGALGIIICSYGLTSCIAANKIPTILAVTCNEPCSASIARSQLSANILCLGSKLIGCELAFTVVSSFLLTPFDNGNVEYLENLNIIRGIENNSF